MELDPDTARRALARVERQLRSLTRPKTGAKNMALLEPDRREEPSFRTLTTGGTGTFSGASTGGRPQPVKIDQSLSPSVNDGGRPSFSTSRSFTRPTPTLGGDIQRPDTTMTSPGIQNPAVKPFARPTPQAGNVPVTTITANPSAHGGAQFWQDQAASFPRTFTRPQPRPAQTNPAVRATGLTFDDTVRRLEMAQNRAEWDSKKVQRSRGRDAANQQVVQFWADQAASIPGAEARMAELQAQQQGETARADAANQTQANIASGRNATDLTSAQLQQEGANLRNDASNASALAQETLRFSRPQPRQMVVREDGTVGFAGPDGFSQTTDAQGQPIRLQRPAPQIDQGALARLSSDLMPQFLGVDNYGQIADPAAPKGRRAPTAEDRERAYRQATEAARQTLGGTPQTSASAPAPSPSNGQQQARGSVDDFLKAARADPENAGFSDDELREYFVQNYGAR